ncbi:MAG: T9SS type A sorting domain-containing protein, partial [Chitinophagales bacterium]|nr:T9SS type A sorting domain-containing protein [Chitinophagales bacterium]
DKITIQYTSDKSEEVNMYIYDLSGREVFHQRHRLLPGENLIDMNQLQLAKGTYYLDFQTETISRQAKMMAQ